MQSNSWQLQILKATTYVNNRRAQGPERQYRNQRTNCSVTSDSGQWCETQRFKYCVFTLYVGELGLDMRYRMVTASLLPLLTSMLPLLTLHCSPCSLLCSPCSNFIAPLLTIHCSPCSQFIALLLTIHCSPCSHFIAPLLTLHCSPAHNSLLPLLTLHWSPCSQFIVPPAHTSC